MTKAALERYHVRMQRVVDYIDRHLDDDLRLETLSGVAAFSKHHFHRQFTATFGVSVHRYVRLARMKRASYQLAFRDGDTVTDIAMDAGYDAPEAFARAFRECIGQSPSGFRKSPDWEPWFAAFGPLYAARTVQMKTYTRGDVKIVDVAAIPVALVEHRGNPARIGETIQRFVAWRRLAGLAPTSSPTFTVFHDPEPARPGDFHVDLCVGTDRSVSVGDDGVKGGVIPGGRCAVLRVIGPSDDLSAPAVFLYLDWLPESGEETRDFPLYCQRLSFFPDVPEHEAVTDLFLPLK